MQESANVNYINVQNHGLYAG